LPVASMSVDSTMAIGVGMGVGVLITVSLVGVLVASAMKQAVPAGMNKLMVNQ
ncbi:multiple epidermal growth factor-like domains protein 11, partial [Biomphalaria glabrata]